MWNNHVHPKLLSFFLRLGVTTFSQLDLFTKMWNLVLLIPNICMCSKWQVDIQMQYLCRYSILLDSCIFIYKLLQRKNIEWKKRYLVWAFNEIGNCVNSSKLEWDCTWAHNFQLTMWFDSLVNALFWKKKFKQFGLNFQWNWNSCRFIKFWIVIRNKFAISHTFFVVYISILKKTHWFGFIFFGRLIGLSFQWNWNSCGLIKFWVVDWKWFTLSNTMSISLLHLIPW